MSAFAKAFGQIRARSSSQNLVFQDSSADRATQSQLALRSETRASERINVASGKSESKPSLDVEWSRISERKLRDSEIVRSVKNRAHVVLGKIPEKSTGTFPPKQWYTSGIIHAITAPKVSVSI